MSDAAKMVIDNVRISMHNVLESSFGDLHDLGEITRGEGNSYSFELTMHAKPDAWDRPRAMHTQLFFDNAANLQDFLSSMKNQIDTLRSKLYSSMENTNQLDMEAN